MNDKKKHQGGFSASLCTNISIFTTITSDEQYFLNEKAVVRSYEKSVICWK